MKYHSTRGGVRNAQFSDVLFSGLASDGGLYLPMTWPRFENSDLGRLASLSYNELAFDIVKPFVDGALDDTELKEVITRAYESFDGGDVAPLRGFQGNHHLMELFHGPTLAFKDVAMQLLGHLMGALVKQRGGRISILGATSGDTGAAAVNAFADREGITLYMLHAKGRITDTQRRQMTTCQSPNIFNIAIDSTFDACQNLVKVLMTDKAWFGPNVLTTVNSINWARILGQSVYYAYGALKLAKAGVPVNFVVPTGNFGNAFSGYVARRMGFPVGRIIIASNLNDVLPRMYESGIYERRPAVATISSAMDIQTASNYERLLFELSGGNADKITDLMRALNADGRFSVPQDIQEKAGTIYLATMVSENETKKMMQQAYKDWGQLIDPHTAVGLAAALRLADQLDGPLVTLSTAHPAKFGEVLEDVHTKPFDQAAIMPKRLQAAMEGDERVTEIDASASQLKEFMIERVSH